MAPHTGISNRQDPEEERRSREQFPRIDTGSPPPEDAAGRVGDEPLNEVPQRHTSHRMGARATLKPDDSRNPDRPHPATHKVGGAFGREPKPVNGEGDTE